MNPEPLHQRFRYTGGFPKKISSSGPPPFRADFIDLSPGPYPQDPDGRHLDPYPNPPDPFGLGWALLPSLANSLFNSRAAASVRADVGSIVYIQPNPASPPANDDNALQERKKYRHNISLDLLIPYSKCLSAMAYLDYFTNENDVSLQDGHGNPLPPTSPPTTLRSMVKDAIKLSSPGYCGAFPPGVGDDASVGGEEGNYDMTQMFLLPLVYNYYNELMKEDPTAVDHLITELLKQGHIQRLEFPLSYTNGPSIYWWLVGSIDPEILSIILGAIAGAVIGVAVGGVWGAVIGAIIGGIAGAIIGAIHGPYRIPETENHVLMIMTARYLTNQLLYQRDPGNAIYDNRSNGNMDILISLLRNYLIDDFAEYNSKSYQVETRRALLNLCSYAYDAEVQLGARMVLDYVSAHMAVSSNDLRRLVPFRRHDYDPATHQSIPGSSGYGFPGVSMDVSLMDGSSDSADPIAVHFALLAGNTRALGYNIYPGTGQNDYWGLTRDLGKEFVVEALSDYRLPLLIHDLFLNDSHRRFYQRLHRHPLPQGSGLDWQKQWNCENMEIYSSSPSYLITAGGQPNRHAIPGAYYLGIPFGWDDGDKPRDDMGVAVPISFLPTGNMLTLNAVPSSGGVAIPTVDNVSVAAPRWNEQNSTWQAATISLTGNNVTSFQITKGPNGGNLTDSNGNNIPLNSNISGSVISYKPSTEPYDYEHNPFGFLGYDYFMYKGLGINASSNIAVVAIGNWTMRSTQSIQLMHYDDWYDAGGGKRTEDENPDTENYGVAPDFACGWGYYLPDWCIQSMQPKPQVHPDGTGQVDNGIYFVDKSHNGDERAGFYLAIIIQAGADNDGTPGGFMLLEAFDAWRHPEIPFDHPTIGFKQRVMANNSNIQLGSGQEAIYTTYFGNKVHFVIWNTSSTGDNGGYGSKILNIEYGSGDPLGDPSADAGNDTAPFLSGTVLKSAGDGMIEIHNPFIVKTIKLDWRNPLNPQRAAEDGKVEQAGVNSLGQLYRVWVDFDWTESQDGNFYHPVNTLASALAKVADGGSIKIMPGTTSERPTIHHDKNITLSAPIGDVTIG